MNLSNEEFNKLCREFICFAYNEMHTEGWRNRRMNFIIQYDNDNCKWIPSWNDDSSTIIDICENKYNGNQIETIMDFFLEEIRYVGWIEAWIYLQRPDFDCRENIWSEEIEYLTNNNVILYCIARDMLYLKFLDFINGDTEDKLKDILSIDIFYLK
jgi:hypothetical protein